MFALASVYGLRMFGLFLILPVLALYADTLEGATPLLMGLALGIYGVTQALFQIPFGILSDRFGRKPIILIGLSIFVLGSVVAALSDTITGVIIGRALQGAGAIAAVVLALTSDLTRENQRTKAMAMIGMTIGLAFMLALVTAPWLEFLLGVPTMFGMTAVLALLSMVVILKIVPTPTTTNVSSPNLEVRPIPSRMRQLLKDPQLIRLDLGIFILHFVLTAMFVVVPIILLRELGMETHQHWSVYVPALLVSVVLMIPLIILSARKHWVERIFFVGVCILLIAQTLLIARPLGALGLTISLIVFFWGFNLLEAMLPSLVSRLAPAASKGSAMGVYNTFQFLGIFMGGTLGGLLYGQVGTNAVFALCSVLLVVWVFLLHTAPTMRLLDSLVVKIDPSSNVDLLSALEQIAGVEEVIILEGENTAYLKIDKDQLDRAALDLIIANG